MVVSQVADTNNYFYSKKRKILAGPTEAARYVLQLTNPSFLRGSQFDVTRAACDSGSTSDEQMGTRGKATRSGKARRKAQTNAAGRSLENGQEEILRIATYSRSGRQLGSLASLLGSLCALL